MGTADERGGRFGRRLGRFAAWALVSLGVLELVSRRYISRPFPCLRPSADATLRFELRPGTFDSDGYLERLPETRYVIGGDGCQQTGGGPSLLALGSSHAFGLGVDQRRAFPDLLRRALAARGHGLTGTLNCSVPGHHLLPSLRAAELALARAPQPLTLVFVSSHHLQTSVDWSALAPRGQALAWLTSHLRLARVLYLFRLQQQLAGGTPQYETAERLNAGLDRFAAAVRAARSRGVVVLHGLLDHPGFSLAAEARRRGLTVVEIPAVPNDPAWTLDDEHWNARGHRHVAEALTGPVAAALREPAAGGVSD